MIGLLVGALVVGLLVRARGLGQWLGALVLTFAANFVVGVALLAIAYGLQAIR